MRLTQAIEYLKAEKHPTAEESHIHYTHITITERLKEIRRTCRREQKQIKSLLEGNDDH